jgi:hypothetical protein
MVLCDTSPLLLAQFPPVDTADANWVAADHPGSRHRRGRTPENLERLAAVLRPYHSAQHPWGCVQSEEELCHAAKEIEEDEV